MTGFITEDFIIKEVQKNTKYYSQLKEPYVIHWDGEVFAAKDTRDLVKKIAKYEGVDVR